MSSAVIINGQVVDLDDQRAIPVAPSAAWDHARARLEEARWSASACARAFADYEVGALLLGLETICRRAPIPNLSQFLLRLEDERVERDRWLGRLTQLPQARATAMVERCGEQPLAVLLGSHRRWPVALERVIELVRLEPWSGERSRRAALARLAAHDDLRATLEEACQRWPERVPFSCFEVLLLRKAAPGAWFERAVTNQTLARRLKRAAITFDRTELLPRFGQDKPLVPRKGTGVARAFERLVARTASAPRLTRPAKQTRLDEHRLPPEVRALWSIANGQRPSTKGLFAGLEFLGLEASLQRKKLLQKSLNWLRAEDELWVEAGARDDELFSDDWLPIASADYRMVVVSGVTGRVFTVEKDAPPLQLTASSVSDWLSGLDADDES
ncbi:MAG: SMI1/KNR4 family protein [Archangium sp.]|nr:SMI1/KNR4 family protein [Archangium sp.]